MPRLLPLALLAALALGVLALAACSRVSAENYEKLRVGMTLEEVEHLLGSPDECSQKLGVRSCRWGDDSHNIRVNFVGDAAAVFTSKNLR